MRAQVPDPIRGPDLQAPPVCEEMHQPEGLHRIDQRFLAFLGHTDPLLQEQLLQARRQPQALNRAASSALMLALAEPLEVFLIESFALGQALTGERARHRDFEALYRVKWKFVRRQAVLGVPPERLRGFDADAAREQLQAGVRAQARVLTQSDGPERPNALQAPRGVFDEADFARAVLTWQAHPEHAALLEQARLYSAWAATTPQGQALHADSVLFRLPQAHDPAEQAHGLPRQKVQDLPEAVIRLVPRSARLGAAETAFALTDRGTDTAGALDQTRYCLICHKNGTDSCSHGLNAQHTGCPLGERISEFHALRNDGLTIAALAMIVRDNPLVAATGHRICNDCVQACVFQNQTPVDIPQAETQTLQQVLALPWGVEIYDLLTRWNPLHFERPLPRPETGRKVLVVGAGPAGFTLAHQLLQEGHTVVLIDALRIEPLVDPDESTHPGRAECAPDQGAPVERIRRAARRPIGEIARFELPLQERKPSGFGGVAEYGITVRWDKNRLDLIRRLLERRDRFSLMGGVRLGSNLSVQDALDLGFDHLALAVGAGRPHLPDWPQALVQGVRTASDFLMALQLQGAARQDSLAALQIRLPAVVIGGGLTALDASTELQAWYVVQVLRYAQRHRALVQLQGEAAIAALWTDQDRETALTFLAHAQAIESEQASARMAGRAPDLKPLLQSWGGVTVLYRRSLAESPAWRTNPAEVLHALEEGIRFAERVQPTHFESDADGAVSAVMAGAQRWPARSVLLALGTQPNTGLADDEPDVRRDGPWFALQDDPEFAVLLADPPGASQDRRGRLSVFGDAHPQGAGSVVKAMASAHRGAAVVSRALAARPARSRSAADRFMNAVRAALQARVASIAELAPGIVQIKVHAPAAARRFKPGQFFRLQTFEHDAPRITVQGLALHLAMEGLALTGAAADPEEGTVTLVVLEMGGSSDLCRCLRPGQAVVLMGPTGQPTEIVSRQTVVLAGGGLGNAVLLPIGAALRAAGSRVLYFAAYRRAQDLFHRETLEAAADQVVWCCESDPPILPHRPQDHAFHGNIVEALCAWQDGLPIRTLQTGAESTHPGPTQAQTLGPPAGRIGLHEANRLLVIGSDRMMGAVAQARRTRLKSSLGRPEVVAIASVNSPMQCMMKGICGQCLQWIADPVSGQTRAVFTCAEQDQPLDWVRFDHLAQRLGQNRLAEQQTRALLHCTKPRLGR